MPAFGRALRATFAALVVCLGSLTANAAGLTYSWTGGAGNRWSEQANWNPVGVPGPGDNLAFPAGAMNAAMVNDLPDGTAFAMLQFNGGGYRLSGNRIGLTSGLSNGADIFTENVIEVRLVAQGDISLAGANYQGGLDLGGHTLRLVGSSGLRFTGPVTGTGQILSPYLTNPRFSGSHPFSGVIRGSVVLENAELPNASIDQPIEGFMLAGDLKGPGLVGGNVRTTFVFPHLPFFSPRTPGLLRVGGHLSVASAGMFSGSASFVVNGAGAGTGHDQVRVAEGVSIGAMTFVNVEVAATLTTAVGQEFVLVDNQGASPVSGSFANLLEGSILVAGSYQFRFTYAGGDGNDIAIVCTLAPNLWRGTIDGRWSEASNWSGGVPVPGSDLIFPPGATTLATVNDLPAGIAYRSLRLNGSGYRLAGNGIGIGMEVDVASGFPGNVIDLDIAATGDIALGGGTFNGAISLGARSMTVTLATQFNGPVSGTGTIHVPYLVNPRLTGTHPFAGVIRGGVVLQSATLPNASMDLPTTGPMISGSLLGNGMLGGAVTTNFVGPGAGTGSFMEPPGRLSVGSLTLATGFMSSSLDILLNGPGAGTGFDQVRVTQGVNLGTNSFLNVTMNPSFVPSVGQEFVIVDHLGSGPIVGSFNHHPEGTTITLGSYQFRLTYVGGDGNDISLICTVAPNVWTGAVDGRWSVAGNWSGGVPAAGSDLTFPPGAANLALTNDLPAGVVFRSIRVTGGGYRLGGNAIGLTHGVDGSMGAGVSANRLALPITAHGDLGIGGVTLEGALDLGATTLRIASGTAAFEGPIAGTGTIHAPYLANPRLRGTHSFAGVIRGGVLLDNASLPNASMDLPTEGQIIAATLQGNGTIGGSVTINSVLPSGSGAFFPPPPGILNVGSLRFATGFMSSSLMVRIHGPRPGSGYDQLVAGNSVDLGTNTFLNLQLSPGFVPTAGDTYTLIDNRGPAPITGTFNGLPEGTEIVLLGVYRFKLSYAGGQGGNDVVLVSLNGKSPTMTTLTSSANPSTPSTPVTFTAAVTRTTSSSDPPPSGSMRFWSGSGFSMVPLVNGTATFTAAFPAGSHTLRAEYPGDNWNGGSSSPDLVQVVSAQGSTAPGSDVTVEVETTLPGGGTATVDIQFASVSGAGTTTVTASTSGPTPPAGFQLGDPPLYFDVNTTALFNGEVTLCFGWSEGQFANESAIGLWHHEGGAWVNVTTMLDTVANTVCGRTTSLSPFALMETRFAFSGFLMPIAPMPAFNAVKAGAAVPIRFSLGGDRGLAVFASGYPASATVACGASSGADPLAETSTAGGSTLAYDAASAQYTYVWKTEKSWAGTCRALVLRFTDGTHATAGFDFK